MADVFGPIPPAPASDIFVFDFTQQIGAGTITSAVWNCTVDETSRVADPLASSRVIGTPTYSATKTSALVGGMIDDCLYMLEATVAVSDERVLTDSASLHCTTTRETVVLLANPGWAQFDYDYWVARFPAFNGLDPEMALRFWNQATLFHRNDGHGPIKDLGVQTYCLALLTAHLAQLYGGAGGGPGGVAGGPGMVGRISSKSVGGVSLSAEGFNGISGMKSILATTQYGADYLYATQSYRTMRYVPMVRWPGRGRLPVWR